MENWRRLVGPAGFVMVWTAAVAFVEKLPSFSATVRGLIALIALVTAVAWTTQALCPAPARAPGFVRPPQDGASLGGLAARVLALAAVAGLCWMLGVSFIAYPALVIAERHPPGYSGATQIECRPPHTDAPASFALRLWSTDRQGAAGELPCRCQDWNPAITVICEMGDWSRDGVTLTVKDLRHPAVLGIWCDGRVSHRLSKPPAAMGVLYGGSLKTWNVSLLLAGGIAWMGAVGFCWRQSQH